MMIYRKGYNFFPFSCYNGCIIHPSICYSAKNISNRKIISAKIKYSTINECNRRRFSIREDKKIIKSFHRTRQIDLKFLLQSKKLNRFLQEINFCCADQDYDLFRRLLKPKVFMYIGKWEAPMAPFKKLKIKIGPNVVSN